jgi:hypothetical protein
VKISVGIASWERWRELLGMSRIRFERQKKKKLRLIDEKRKMDTE